MVFLYVRQLSSSRVDRLMQFELFTLLFCKIKLLFYIVYIFYCYCFVVVASSEFSDRLIQ